MSETHEDIYRRLMEGVSYRSDWALVDACKELEKANERIEDYVAGIKIVLDEKCPTDEIHCVCVPMLRARIAELEAERRWIPVSEGLPEYYQADEYGFSLSQVVLIRDKNNCVFWAEFDGNNWRNTNSNDNVWMSKDNVTHWMPLPTPPEKK